MAKKTTDIASVLAFEKKMVASDAYMYSTTWENKEEAVPIQLVEKSVRGTISNRLNKAAVRNDPLKLNAEVQKPNLQTVDSAALSLEQDTLKLCFTLKFLAGVQNPSACNNSTHYAGIQKMGQGYIEKYGFKEVAKRYAMNLANGRFLWRNRIGAEKIEIVVSMDEENKSWTFDAYQYDLKSFDQDDEQVDELSGYIADALCGKRNYAFFKVTAYVLLGSGQDVYPSEELILDKGRGKKSKVLYSVNGIAAMHSQKISNALRTIDTWYPDYEDGIGPIAIETYGSVTALGRAYRTPKDKKDFYTLFDAWSTGNELSCEEDEHYVMAVLVRGGVFGQSGKDDE